MPTNIIRKRKRLPILRRTIPPDLSLRHLGALPRLKGPIRDFNEQFELPRWHFKPLDGIDFDTDGSLSVTANMAYTEVIRVTLPVGYEGVLKFIGHQIEATPAAGDFFDTNWRLLVNGATVKGWETTVTQRGTTAVPMPVTIFLRTGSVISFRVTNTTANTHTARARLVGWTWIVKDVFFASLE